MKVNFKKIVIPTLEGEGVERDFSQELGNSLYYQSTDLKGSELGRKIYFGEGDVELDDDEVKIVKDKVEQMYASYVFKMALLSAIDNG